MSAKELKEAFVTGHSGASAYEVLLVCISAPIGILLFHEIRNYCRLNKKNELLTSLLVAVESCTVLLPMAICQTDVLIPYGAVFLSVELFFGLVLFTYRRYIYESSRGSNSSYAHDGSPSRGIRTTINKSSPRSPSSPTSPSKLKMEFIPTSKSKMEFTSTSKSKMEFLTFYRSTVSYLTFVAILAVDFTIFPRSYAKTEVYGYGLMDLGAASFCVSGGFVSWFARSQTSKFDGMNRVKQDQENKKRSKKVLRHTIPLLIMGVIRLATTKGLEYQEHFSEYGVHWNFFFTLALVNIISTSIRSYLMFRSPVLPWALILICYQSMLSLGNVHDYIINAPRNCDSSWEVFFFCDFFASNREGLLGCIGYLIIFLASEDIGRYCIWSAKGNQTSTQGIRLFFVTVAFWLLHWVSSSTKMLGIIVSRRSTNVTFIAWVIAHNVTILLLIWLSFYFCSKGSINGSYPKGDLDRAINPPIFAAVNRHGLIVFIIANLMTGVINLSMNTMKAKKHEAIIVIFCYLCAIGGVALFTDYIFSYRSYLKTKTKS